MKVSGCRRHRLASKPLKKNLKLSQEIKNETRLERLFHLVLFSTQSNYVLENDDDDDDDGGSVAKTDPANLAAQVRIRLERK